MPRSRTRARRRLRARPEHPDLRQRRLERHRRSSSPSAAAVPTWAPARCRTPRCRVGRGRSAYRGGRGWPGRVGEVAHLGREPRAVGQRERVGERGELRVDGRMVRHVRVRKVRPHAGDDEVTRVPAPCRGEPDELGPVRGGGAGDHRGRCRPSSWTRAGVRWRVRPRRPRRATPRPRRTGRCRVRPRSRRRSSSGGPIRSGSGASTPAPRSANASSTVRRRASRTASRAAAARSTSRGRSRRP